MQTANKIEMCTEEITAINSLPLILSFEPGAIRDHFDGNDRVYNLTDEQLAEIGESALQSDLLYKEFHRALVAATIQVVGFDPNEETDESGA